jgi:alanine dehydrogenase
MANERGLTIGFPRMVNEPGERRAFLPPLVGLLASMDVEVFVETGSGAGMGYPDEAYASLSPRVHIVDEATAYAQDIVVVLRAPEGRYELLRRGAILLSMLHFSTRPERVELLGGLGIEAIALDMVTGDDGRRLVQNLREVARNGLSCAFDALERRWPPPASPCWARAAWASTRSSGLPRAATRSATRGSWPPACPASRSWSWSRTSRATRPTSGTAWR